MQKQVVLKILGNHMPSIPVAEGFDKDVLPIRESLRNWLQFFDKNRPCFDQVSLRFLKTPTWSRLQIEKLEKSKMQTLVLCDIEQNAW